MTTHLDWARNKFVLEQRWIYTIHPSPGTKLAAVLAACDGAWRTSREVTRLTGLKGGTVRPLLYAAANKRLLLRRRTIGTNPHEPTERFKTRWQYRQPET